MEIRIETVTINLLDTLYEIEKQSFQHEAFSKREISYLLKDYNSISLVARVDGEIAGFAIGRIEETNGAQVGHIFTIETLPSHRRRGVAQKLLIALETLFGERGVGESRLEVREGNVAAIGLYEKTGYVQAGRLERYYGKAHGLYLRKTLSPKADSS